MDSQEAELQARTYQDAVENLDKVEAIAYLSNKGVPLEVVTRMETLWQQTIKAGNEIVYIGRAIIARIIEFIEQHPHMAIGLALGLSLCYIANAIPLVGPLIAPIITLIGGAMGAVYGYRVDQVVSGKVADTSIFESAIRLVKEFWELFCDVFRSLVVDPVNR